MKTGSTEVKMVVSRNLLIGIAVGLAAVYFFKEVLPLMGYGGLPLPNLRFH